MKNRVAIAIASVAFLFALAAALPWTATAADKSPKDRLGKLERISGDKSAKLAPGHRFVRTKPNAVAVYKANTSTGVSLQCACGSEEGGGCTMLIIRDTATCKSDGCPSCYMGIWIPKGRGGIVSFISSGAASQRE